MYIFPSPDTTNNNFNRDTLIFHVGGFDSKPGKRASLNSNHWSQALFTQRTPSLNYFAWISCVPPGVYHHKPKYSLLSAQTIKSQMLTDLNGLALGLHELSRLAALFGPWEVQNGNNEEGVAVRETRSVEEEKSSNPGAHTLSRQYQLRHCTKPTEQQRCRKHHQPCLYWLQLKY